MAGDVDDPYRADDRLRIERLAVDARLQETGDEVGCRVERLLLAERDEAPRVREHALARRGGLLGLDGDVVLEGVDLL